MGFQYQPLKFNEFRLLKPVSQPSNTLSFDLVHISLLSKPRYVALSYTRGPKPDTHTDPPTILPTIQLNKQHFAVRQNLHNALQQIKASKLIDDYLWVDAICINQAEDDEDALDERSLQITLMKQIYIEAAKIIVWLGKPKNDENNRLAFSMMKGFNKRFLDLQQKRRPYRPWWWKRKENPLWTHGQDIAAFLRTISPATDKEVFDVPGSLTHTAWLGMISLWKQPWWTRTWVFQESTVPERHTSILIAGLKLPLAPIKVKFICGDQETNWDELAITSIVALNIQETPGIDSRFLVGARDSASKVETFRGRRVQHIYPSFLDSLQMFRHTSCFDPRDKVYAPLCLAPDDVRRFIQPDYGSKTVVDVYMNVVQYYLAQPGHELDFLGYALYQDGAQVVETPKTVKWPDGFKSALPSWVPNFSANINLAPIPKILHVPKDPQLRRFIWDDRHDTLRNNETLVAAYRPLGDTPSRSFIEGNTLYVSGVYIDSLKDISLSTGPNLEAIQATAREKGSKWAIDSRNKYFTGESFANAAQHNCVLDLVYDEQMRPSQRGGKRDATFMKRPRAELSLAEFRLQMNMRNAHVRASISRHMGLSQRMYLLMVPITAVVGDLIWAMAGGQVFYILRPVSREKNQYRFIGECYVHGLMDGEILRRLQLGESKMDDISLI
jgi:hypothetical protein